MSILDMARIILHIYGGSYGALQASGSLLWPGQVVMGTTNVEAERVCMIPG